MHWEGAFDIGVVSNCLVFKSPVFPGLNIKLIAILRIFISWQVAESASKYSLSEFTEVGVGLGDLGSELLSELLLLTIDKNL